MRPLGWMLMAVVLTPAGVGLAQGLRPPAKKPQGKATSLRVRVNVAQASLSVDDVLVARAGEAFDAKPGPVLLHVEAPGYLGRWLPLEIKAGEQREVQVNLLRMPDARKVSAIVIKAADGFADPRHVPGYCQGRQAAVGKEKDLACDKGTGTSGLWLDDAYAAHLPLDDQGLPSLFMRAVEKEQLAALQKDLQERRLNEAWRERAEALVARVPDDATVHATAALGSVFLGRCERSLAFVNEMRVVGRKHKGLDLALAFCYELAGEGSKARQWLESVQQQQPRLPEIYYHVARLSLLEAQDKMDTLTQMERDKLAQRQEEPALTCLKLFPTYLPCLELLRVNRLARGDNGGVLALFQGFLGSQSHSAPLLLDKALAMVGQGEQGMADKMFAAFLQGWTADSDVLIAYFAYATKTGRTPDLARAKDLLQPRRTRDYKASAKLGDIVAKAGAFDLATLVFRHILAEDGKRDYARWQLVNLARQKKDYAACAAYAADVPLSYANPIVNSMRRLQAECLMRQKRYAEAAPVYETLAYDPKQSWQLYYNWGMALERSREHQKAIEVFSKVLDMGPPAPVAARVQDLLKSLSKDEP